MNTHTSLRDERILIAGRILLYVAVFAIPLAFCRETMYIFQLKTFLLQYIGMGCLALMSLHMLLSSDAYDLTRKWAIRFMLLFLVWQVFKSWDSIAPLISFRQMSRVYWLPIISISVLYFFRERKQIERLINVLIVSAVLVNIYTWCLYQETLRVWIFGPESNRRILGDFANTPLGPILKSLFYPEEFRDILASKKAEIFPYTMRSFYPGKPDAGTFGSKNFITGYLNMSSAFMLYRAVTLMWSKTGNLIAKRGCSVLLFIIGLSGYFHISRLGNRGAQLGMLVAFAVIILYLVYIFLISRRRMGLGSWIKIALAFLVLMSSAIFTVYKLDEERFVSIFSVTAGSNELRRHTWSSYYDAWTGDTEWKGFTNPIWRVATGLGNYTFRVIYPKYRSERIFKIEYNQHNTETSHPHNEYLGYFGELGLIGFALYAFMILFLLYLITKRAEENDFQTKLLKAALFFCILTQLVHQTVGVGIRYSGVAFQFWLMLGLSLAVGIKPDELIPKQKRISTKIIPVTLMMMAIYVMPSFLFPVQWFRSQHFYEMGQIHYGWVRDIHKNIEKQQNAIIDMKRKENDPSFPKNRQKLLKQKISEAQQMLNRMKRQFQIFYDRADRYFEAGWKYDSANFESIYIGANMNVQFANISLAAGETEKCKALYERALRWYKAITEEMPYFVQSRYWQGVCHKGLGAYYHEKYRRGDQTVQAALKKHFSEAIKFYKRYELQDPIYRESYFDKFYIYMTLNKHQLALNELREMLISYEKGGHNLFHTDNRYDTIRLVEQFVKTAPEKESKEALQILAILLDYKRSTGLLPFVPKTERHIKNSFKLLPIL